MAAGLSNPIEEGLVVLPDVINQHQLTATVAWAWDPPAGTRAALFCPNGATVWVRKYDQIDGPEDTAATVMASGDAAGGFIPLSAPALFKIETGMDYEFYSATTAVISIGIYGRT